MPDLGYGIVWGDDRGCPMIECRPDTLPKSLKSGMSITSRVGSQCQMSGLSLPKARESEGIAVQRKKEV